MVDLVAQRSKLRRCCRMGATATAQTVLRKPTLLLQLTVAVERGHAGPLLRTGQHERGQGAPKCPPIWPIDTIDTIDTIDPDGQSRRQRRWRRSSRFPSGGQCPVGPQATQGLSACARDAGSRACVSTYAIGCVPSDCANTACRSYPIADAAAQPALMARVQARRTMASFSYSLIAHACAN